MPKNPPELATRWGGWSADILAMVVRNSASVSRLAGQGMPVLDERRGQPAQARPSLEHMHGVGILGYLGHCAGAQSL